MCLHRTHYNDSADLFLDAPLMEDTDIECTAVMPGGAGGDFSVLSRADERNRGLPETASELYAYDAIILSNVPRETISDRHLAWIDDWVARRGGGLCMVGGPNSFGSGGWAETVVGKMLPIALASITRDWEDGPTTLKPVVEGHLHPIWQIAADESENLALLKTLPKFSGHNRLGREKPNAEVLATTGTDPAMAVEPFGRGRTMAMTVPITRRYASEFTQSWGGNDARYYKKFWRNVVYWLTENSSVGRRRLLAQTDKRLYRPGEPIIVTARAFDENASPTLDYRVAVSVEPKSAAEGRGDNSPLRRPPSLGKVADGQGPLIPWGEEFDLAKGPAEKTYDASLAIADTKSLPTGVSSSQSLRIELTAYEGNTQVDSTAIDVQILDDPTEQQNPIPDHDLLRRIAAQSGGKVIDGAKPLAAMLDALPISVGPPEIKAMPAWSRWWMLNLLIALLTVEWAWRRRIGLA